MQNCLNLLCDKGVLGNSAKNVEKMIDKPMAKWYSVLVGDLLICGSVGTGRRARLRILWQQCRVGSSPIFRIGFKLRKP